MSGRCRAAYGRDMDPLAGQTVLVTGASSGIGRATAIAAARRGARVVLVARRHDELEQVRARIEAADGAAYSFPCDLYDVDAIDALVGEVLAKHGPVDILVNNAGHSIRRSIQASVDRPHDFERSMQLNYFAPVRLTLGFLPGMRERGSGRIVNVTSQAVQVHPPRFAAYVASKCALEGFGRSIGRDLLSEGITVCSVRMPLVRTPMIRPSRGAFRGLPSLSAQQGADLVLRAMTSKGELVSTSSGQAFGALAGVAPDMMRLLMHRVVYLRGRETAPEIRGERPVSRPSLPDRR
jgi:NAD(P)-dependent dehydrogenase (short-subunit alcohol dehydrogenase family)